MLAWSLQQRTAWLTLFHWARREGKGSGIGPTVLLASCLFNMLLLRVLGKREWGGVAAHGLGPDAGMCRLGSRPSPVWHPCDKHLHAHGTPLDSICFSHLWDNRLNTWHWKDWQVLDRSGGYPRWALIQWYQREEKNMWVQGDFLTIYPIRRIVYFLHISQRVHLWAPFTTSNRQVGRHMAVKIRWWLINGLATGFNTQIYNYLYFFLNH